MFRIALTGDFLGPDGQPRYRDLGLDVLQPYSLMQTVFFAEHRPEIDPDQLEGAQAVIVLTPRVTARTVSRSENLLAVARFGVGYDSVDVPACTAADVVVLISKGAVDRPVAEATVGWMLALSHHVLRKDRLVREGRWADRSGFMGCELRDRVLGVIGFGGIGKALIKLLAGFGMAQPLVFDPFISPEEATRSWRPPGGAGRALVDCGFRLDSLPADRGNSQSHRGEGTRFDEAECLPYQHRAGWDRRRGCTLRGVARSPDRRCRHRLLRRGAGRIAPPVRGTRQRPAGAALHRLDG